MVVVVVDVVQHVGTAVESAKHPMSNFLYFPLFWDLLLLFLVFCNFLLKGRKGFHLSAPGAI